MSEIASSTHNEKFHSGQSLCILEEPFRPRKITVSELATPRLAPANLLVRTELSFPRSLVQASPGTAITASDAAV